jgi:hypothetical protein
MPALQVKRSPDFPILIQIRSEDLASPAVQFQKLWENQAAHVVFTRAYILRMIGTDTPNYVVFPAQTSNMDFTKT